MTGSSNKIQIGMLGIVVLVILRLVIGWHFFKEGAKKFVEPDFSASSFLLIAHGPMADLYKSMVLDRYGLKRLDYPTTEKAWNQYAERVANYYGFDENQRVAAKERTQFSLDQFKFYLDSIDGDLYEFRQEIERLKEAKADAATRDVAYQQDRIAAKERELLAKPKPWLAEAASMRSYFMHSLAEIATEKQQKLGAIQPPDPSNIMLLNLAVKWTVILVGVFLMIGLGTPLVCLVGIGFLCSVITSQWPGWHGSEPTYYQVIELVSMLVLAITGAGRFAGLDFFLYPMYCRWRDYL